MNQRALAKIEKTIDPSITSAMQVGGGGIVFNNATEIMEFANMMAASGSAVPKHLRGLPGACLGIVDDAIRFQMSPYALARKSYFVNDNLAYEAQVLAAIVLSRAPLRQRPDITFSGEGQSRKCKVTYHFNDGAIRHYESPELSQINPKNSPLWKSDPDQQQSYYSLRAGARRHCPEVLLGIFDLEELKGVNMLDVTPQNEAGNALQKRLQAKQGQRSDEGFATAKDQIDDEVSEVTADTSEPQKNEAEDLEVIRDEDTAEEDHQDDSPEDEIVFDEEQQELLRNLDNAFGITDDLKVIKQVTSDFKDDINAQPAELQAEAMNIRQSHITRIKELSE